MLRKYRATIDINIVVPDCDSLGKASCVTKKINEVVSKLFKNNKLLLEYFKSIFYDFASDNLFDNDFVISNNVKKRLDKSLKLEEEIFRELSKQLEDDTKIFLEKVYLAPNVSIEDEKFMIVIRNKIGLFSIIDFDFNEIK